MSLSALMQTGTEQLKKAPVFYLSGGCIKGFSGGSLVLVLASLCGKSLA